LQPFPRQPLEIVSGEVDEKETQNQVEDFYDIGPYVNPDNRCLKANTHLTIAIGRAFACDIGK
jgi:hypothetical protein